jgi:hypothetical protein
LTALNVGGMSLESITDAYERKLLVQIERLREDEYEIQMKIERLEYLHYRFIEEGYIPE